MQRPLDCEAAALQIALGAVGINVSQDWALGQFGADLRPPIKSNGQPVVWGDPYQSFVGNVNGSMPNWTGYGVYYPPVVKAARAAGAIADGHEGWAPQQLYDQVALGNPVEVWVPHLMWFATTATWTTWGGRQVWYSVHEHAQVLIGFNLAAGTVTLDDPWDGQYHTFSMALFEQRFATYHSSAVVIHRGASIHPVSWGPGWKDVFWRGANGDLWSQAFRTGGWSAPTDLGDGGLGSDPYPVAWGQSLEVVWRGVDGNLWAKGYSNGWQPAARVAAGPILGEPQPVAWGTQQLDVVWRGQGGSLVRAWLSNGYWSGPQTLVAGGLASDPRAVTQPTSPVASVQPGSGPIDVFWMGTDRNLWHEWWSGVWQGPANLGGPLGSDPHPVALGRGVVTVLWRGTDSGLWQTSFGRAWSGPQFVGPAGLVSDPWPVVTGTGLDVFWRGGDTGLWYTSWNGRWSAASALGDLHLGGEPQPVSLATGGEEVFWGGTDQGIYHDRHGPAWMNGPPIGRVGPSAWTGAQRLGLAA